MSNYKRNEENKTNNDNSGIYCIRNITNNKRYVGQTYNLNYRWSRHKFDLNHNYHSNKHLQSSWNKYGEENFEFIILEYCDMCDLDEKEIYWIDLYDCFNKGYNLAEGGIGCRGYKHTDEEIAKMRMIQNPKLVLQLDLKGNFIKEWSSGAMASKELKISSFSIYNCCKKLHYVKSAKGYIFIYKEDKDAFDKEYYLKLSSNIPKKVSQYTLDLKLVKIWDSIWDASKNGYMSSQISLVCNQKAKTHMGFVWRFTDDNYIFPDNFADLLKTTYRGDKLSKQVDQFDLNGIYINTYKSISDTENYGFNRGSVGACCAGKKSNYKDYIWKYSNIESRKELDEKSSSFSI